MEIIELTVSGIQAHGYMALLFLGLFLVWQNVIQGSMWWSGDIYLMVSREQKIVTEKDWVALGAKPIAQEK